MGYTPHHKNDREKTDHQNQNKGLLGVGDDRFLASLRTFGYLEALDLVQQHQESANDNSQNDVEHRVSASENVEYRQIENTWTAE